MTKKKKEMIMQEKEKKEEERKKIMGEWSEEEEGEAEEKKQINETLGKSEDNSGKTIIFWEMTQPFFCNNVSYNEDPNNRHQKHSNTYWT